MESTNHKGRNMRDSGGMTKLEREISDLENKISNGRGSWDEVATLEAKRRWKARLDRGFGMKRRGWGYA